MLLSLYFYKIHKLHVATCTIVAIFLRRSTLYIQIFTIESWSIPSTKVSQKRNRSSSRDHRPPVPAELSYKSSSQAYPPYSTYPDKSEQPWPDSRIDPRKSIFASHSTARRFQKFPILLYGSSIYPIFPPVTKVAGPLCTRRTTDPKQEGGHTTKYYSMESSKKALPTILWMGLPEVGPGNQDDRYLIQSLLVLCLFSSPIFFLFSFFAVFFSSSFMLKEFLLFTSS